MTPAEAYLEIQARKYREDQHYGFLARLAAYEINVRGPKRPVKETDLYQSHLKAPGTPEPEALTSADREELKHRMQELAMKANPNLKP